MITNQRYLRENVYFLKYHRNETSSKKGAEVEWRKEKENEESSTALVKKHLLEISNSIHQGGSGLQ